MKTKELEDKYNGKILENGVGLCTQHVHVFLQNTYCIMERKVFKIYNIAS